MRSLATDFMASPSPETLFMQHLACGIADARRLHKRRTLRAGAAHLKSRTPVFRPLLLGYNGAANTGADACVIEMGRHLMQETIDTYANFPSNTHLKNWDAYLPPLSGRIENLLSRYS
ncbi:MAG: hypothetical protein ACXWIN_11525 [Burkholderiaceae bacterium]